MALLTAAAFSMTGSIETKGSIFHRFVSEINGQSAEFLLIFVGCAFLYLKKWNVFRKSSKWITHLLAAVFAGCMLVGMSFHTLGSWAFIFSGKKQMVIAFLTFVGFGFLLDFLLSLLYGFLSTLTEKKSSRAEALSYRLESFYPSPSAAFCLSGDPDMLDALFGGFFSGNGIL